TEGRPPGVVSRCVPPAPSVFPSLPKPALNRYTSSDMATVAERLQAARETQNLTISQVAEVTKIRTDHLRALEEGNFDVFSAPVYIRGFVRSCAPLLKLHVPQTMSALDAELERLEKLREPPPFPHELRGVLDGVVLQLSSLD